MVAAAVAGGTIAAGVAGSAMSSSAAGKAASQSANASKQAAQMQQDQYEQTRADLQPYVQAGYNNLGTYQNFWQNATDQYNQVFNAAQSHIPDQMTEENVKNAPGYQFNLHQGLQAMQNSAAAKGLGVSGAAMKASGNYATGLADSYWKDYFNQEQSIYNDYLNQAQLKGNQLGSIYSMVAGPVQTGETAAAQTGDYGQKAASSAGGYVSNAGTAQAAGTTAAANAWQSGLNTVSNAANNWYAQTQT